MKANAFLRRWLLAAAVGVLAAGGAVAQTDWCRSKYGPNDEIGAANLLTPQMAAEAAKLVRTGKTYPLGLETNATRTRNSCRPTG